jgi:hypothetical protein
VIGPSIEAGAIVDARSIDVHLHSPVPVAAVVAVVFMAVVVVSPPAKIAAMVAIPALSIPGTATLGDHAAVARALHRDSAVAVQLMMDIHPPLGVMHVADPAVGTGSNRAAVLCDVRIASLGSDAPGCRVDSAGG